MCEECKGLDYGFETARAPLRYEGVGKAMVHALKYRGYRAGPIDRVMAPLMLEALEGSFDVVVPVPLHRSRLRSRGFNTGGANGSRSGTRGWSAGAQRP